MGPSSLKMVHTMMTSKLSFLFSKETSDPVIDRFQSVLDTVINDGHVDNIINRYVVMAKAINVVKWCRLSPLIVVKQQRGWKKVAFPSGFVSSDSF